MIYGTCSIVFGSIKSQKNKEIVMKSFEIVGNGDYEGMDMYIASDYVRHCQATPELVVESLDAFKEFIRNTCGIYVVETMH